MNILTMAERDTLTECEKIIERGQQTFVEVGLAIAKIRDRKLYRVSYPTFDVYCQSRWGWSRQRAHQLIEASAAVKSLPPKMSTMVDNERAARSVAGIPKETREAVVEAAAATGSVTAKTVEAAAKKIVEAEIVHHDASEFAREIPAKIAPLWLTTEATAKDLLALAHKIKSAMKDGIDNRETNLTWIDCTNGDVSGIQATINTLNLTVKPFAVCYVCNGHSPAKCKLCRGRGFIGRHLWTTAPKEVKDMLSKSKKK